MRSPLGSEVVKTSLDILIIVVHLFFVERPFHRKSLQSPLQSQHVLLATVTIQSLISDVLDTCITTVTMFKSRASPRSSMTASMSAVHTCAMRTSVYLCSAYLCAPEQCIPVQCVPVCTCAAHTCVHLSSAYLCSAYLCAPEQCIPVQCVPVCTCAAHTCVHLSSAYLCSAYLCAPEQCIPVQCVPVQCVLVCTCAVRTCAAHTYVYLCSVYLCNGVDDMLIVVRDWDNTELLQLTQVFCNFTLHWIQRQPTLNQSPTSAAQETYNQTNIQRYTHIHTTKQQQLLLQNPQQVLDCHISDELMKGTMSLHTECRRSRTDDVSA